MTTTDTQCIIKASGKYYHAYLDGGTDGATETEIQIRDQAGNLKSFGKALKGLMLESLEFQCSDGSILSAASLYGNDSGRVLKAVGCERTIHTRSNLKLAPLSVQITEGMILKIATAD
jgi:hypothetical protein